MNERKLLASKATAAVAALTVTLTIPAGADEPAPFKQTNIHFETNASACDMGIQMSFDTDGITSGWIENPNGDTVFSMNSVIGQEVTDDVTEVFQERVEPVITELVAALGCQPSGEEPEISLAELLAAWPAGSYQFYGESQGEAFYGETELTYRVPAGPEIVKPEDAAVIPAERNLRIQWEKVTEPLLPALGPVTIVGYHVLAVDVTDDLAPGQNKISFDADVSGSEDSFVIPKQFLQPGRVYELEILATEAGGNQTITEGGVFCTKPIKKEECGA